MGGKNIFSFAPSFLKKCTFAI